VLYRKNQNNRPLQENFPQCVNGFIVAKAEGYEDTKAMFSSTAPGSIDVLLDKLYTKTVELNLGGSNYNGEAIISFVSETNSSRYSILIRKLLI